MKSDIDRVGLIMKGRRAEAIESMHSSAAESERNIEGFPNQQILDPSERHMKPRVHMNSTESAMEWWENTDLYVISPEEESYVVRPLCLVASEPNQEKTVLHVGVLCTNDRA